MTECKNCEHYYLDSPKRNIKYAMCIKFERRTEVNHVDRDKRITDPYMYCANINGGACPIYKEAELNQTKLDLKEK